MLDSVKKLLFAFLILTGCKTMRPAVAPGATSTLVVQEKTVSASVSPPDTTHPVDYTLSKTITLNAVIGGDSWPELQAASDFCCRNGGYTIHLNQGDYHISRPWVLAWLNGKDYTTVTLNVDGCGYAKNAQPAYTSNIITDYTNGPAMAIQLNKGTKIRNINFPGKYFYPLTLSQLSVDTMTFAQWNDTSCADNRTAPYCAIVIDPFSDPVYFGTQSPMYPMLLSYYVPGMSRNGSTAVSVEGCAITNFVVGFFVTAAMQYNGDCIDFVNGKIQNCKVEYAYSQAQSKANTLFDIQVWGNTYAVVDGFDYGLIHSDASTAPFVDVLNIAGACHQLLNVFASTHPVSISRVYAEGLFKIGAAHGTQGVGFNNCEFNFSNSQVGLPSPDFWWQGQNTTWTGCTLRVYNGLPTRLVFDQAGNSFIGGSMNAPPVQWNTSLGGSAPALPQFNNLGVFYYPKASSGVLNSNNYDVHTYLGGNDTMHIDRTTFTGWFNSVFPVTGLSVGDILVCSKHYEDQYTVIPACNYPVGYVSAIAGNRVSINYTGWGIHDGDILQPVHYTIKPLP